MFILVKTQAHRYTADFIFHHHPPPTHHHHKKTQNLNFTDFFLNALIGSILLIGYQRFLLIESQRLICARGSKYARSSIIIIFMLLRFVWLCFFVVTFFLLLCLLLLHCFLLLRLLIAFCLIVFRARVCCYILFYCLQRQLLSHTPKVTC